MCQKNYKYCFQLILIFLLFPFRQCAASNEHKASGYVETAYSPEYGLIVLAAATDHGPLRLVLDTGAYGLVIVPSAYRRLFPNKTESPPQNGRDVLNGRFRRVQIGEADLGHVTYHVQDIAELDAFTKLDPAKPFDGSLGVDALRNLTIGIDPVARKVAFWKSGAFSDVEERRFLQTSVAAIAIQETIHHAPFFVKEHEILVDVTVEGVRARMSLDTAGPTTIVGPRLLPYLHPSTVVAHVTTMMMQHEITMEAAAYSHLALSDYDIPHILIKVLRTTNRVSDIGIVGIDLFYSCRFILNFRTSNLAFARYENSTDASIQRAWSLGIFPIALSPRWPSTDMIGLLGNDTDFRGTDLKSTDLVIAVNGVALDQLKDSDLKSTAGAGASHLNLTVLDTAAGLKRESIIIPGKNLHSLRFATPDTAAPHIELLPDVGIRILVPSGGIWIPPRYKGKPLRTQPGGIRIPLAGSGYVIVNPGPIMPTVAPLPSVSGSIYPGSNVNTVAIPPGSIVVEDLHEADTDDQGGIIIYPPGGVVRSSRCLKSGRAES